MHLILNVVIAVAIIAYAAYVIRKTVLKVKAGKCMSCTSKPDEDCHCRRVDGIVGFGDEKRKEK
ncbi:MAG: hypothetical protein PWP51_2428 [Clostridiales bacterium]|jgi:hypothetical protein|nr:hypothetical protein [Clostridiales bacterium]MDN5299875.1 hypothetical protein [Clostridiales bacterium]